MKAFKIKSLLLGLCKTQPLHISCNHATPKSGRSTQAQSAIFSFIFKIFSLFFSISYFSVCLLNKNEANWNGFRCFSDGAENTLQTTRLRPLSLPVWIGARELHMGWHPIVYQWVHSQCNTLRVDRTLLRKKRDNWTGILSTTASNP